MRQESFLRGTDETGADASALAAHGPTSEAERVEAPVSLALEASTPASPDAAPVERGAVEQERALRQALATDEDPARSAHALAGLLCAQERYIDALAVIDTARTRSADPRLRVARAALLRDLGRRAEAATELRMLVHDDGTAALHPGLMFEWAELEWLAGNPSAARAALVELTQAHGSDPWCAENRMYLEELSRALDRRQEPTLALRDQLAELRGAPSIARRIRMLEQLLGYSAADAAGSRLRAQVVAIACADESPAVRARGVKAASPDAEARAEFFAEALADESPIVRRIAAERACAVMADGAGELLVDRMEVEQDPSVFRQLHESLSGIVRGPAAPPEGFDDAAARRSLAEAWRKVCPR